MGKAQETRVAGTSMQLSQYFENKYGVESDNARVITEILIVESQESQILLPHFAKLSDLDELLFSLNEDYANGPCLNSRFCVNFTKLKIEALSKIPHLILKCYLEKLLLGKKPNGILIAFDSAKELLKVSNIVKDSQACVYFRGWNFVGHKTHVFFKVSDVVPHQEFAGGQYICPLTVEDGDRQRHKLSTWRCPFYRDGNYCNISKDQIKEILDKMTEGDNPILSAEGEQDEKRYAFL